MDLSMKISHELNGEWANRVMIAVINSSCFVVSKTSANLRGTEDHETWIRG